jgi:hypothetical protein
MGQEYRFKWVWSILLLSVLVFTNISTVFSEGGISRIDIVSLDSTRFPEVALQARILDADNLPLGEISQQMIVLNENGQPVDFEFRSTDMGNIVAFVIDYGANSKMRGGSGDTRINEMKDIIKRYLTGMGPNDEAMIIQQVQFDTIIVQELTNDKAKLQTALEAIAVPDHPELSYGYNGIQKALDELKSAARAPISKSVVFLSSGVQNAVATLSESAIISYAKDLGYPIHHVMVRDNFGDLENRMAAAMQKVASSTGGMYLYYKTQTDTDKLFNWFSRQRLQYIFTFRSKVNGNSERVIDLTVPDTGSGAPRGSIKYVVNLSQPRVLIEQPVGAQQFIREAPAYDADLNSVEPTSVSVAARIEWSDGFPRRITSAELMVDNATVGTPLMEPGDTLNFNWDLRTYTTPGENNAQLRIRVVDELGYETMSDPINVSIIVNIPPIITPPPTGECENLSGAPLIMCRLNKYTGWLGLGLVLPTLVLAVLAYRKREVIGESMKGAVNFADQAWKRITGGPTEMSAVAYLQVLSEAHKTILGQSIALYKGEKHTIGRDPDTNRIPVLESRSDTVISREHCVITEKDGKWYIRDTGSKYGTFRDGVQLPQLTDEVLNDGDEIAIGPLAYGGVRLLFVLAAPDGSMPSGTNRETR